LSLLSSIHAAHEDDDDDDSNGATKVTTVLLEGGVGNTTTLWGSSFFIDLEMWMTDDATKLFCTTYIVCGVQNDLQLYGSFVVCGSQ
jgi:hypothetical protein